MAAHASAVLQTGPMGPNGWPHVSVIPAQYIDMPIDHFNLNDERVYSNRFWVNSTFYKPGGPVLFMDIGETGVTSGDVYDLIQSNRSIMEITRRFNGLAILWEHRFYGKSLPYPIDDDTGLARDGFEAYQYLTTEQSLEDTVHFAQHFEPDGFSSNATSRLHPSRTPWIFVGGSYFGARAAFSRLRNPEVWYAAWSSSGPVQATIDMATYGEQIYQDIPANCSADIRSATTYMDATLEHGSEEEIAVIKSLIFLADRPKDCGMIAIIPDEKLNDVIASASAISDFQIARQLFIAIVHGFQYGWARMCNTCEIIETYRPSKALEALEGRNPSALRGLVDGIYNAELHGAPSSKGISKTYGTFAAFAAVLHAISVLSDGMRTSVSHLNTTSAILTGSMSWRWQTSSEYGFYQVSNISSPYNLVSAFTNLNKWQAVDCNQQFGYPEMPSAPNIFLPNKYGGWTMAPSNVMFVNGAKDPWHTLSVQSTSTEIGAPNRTTTQDISACNQAPADDKVFGLVFADGYHCSDLDRGEHARTAATLFAGESKVPCARSRRGCGRFGGATADATSTSALRGRQVSPRYANTA
ncbi:hypothetical protein LTR53_010950 [Teratosphaeriaceae sp. CCFEE 6253]|nr:hypothetical protein LTR53_010950 [Teratosphaeriaceae sp. CCFEE 6253]